MQLNKHKEFNFNVGTEIGTMLIISEGLYIYDELKQSLAGSFHFKLSGTSVLETRMQRKKKQ